MTAQGNPTGKSIKKPNDMTTQRNLTGKTQPLEQLEAENSAHEWDRIGSNALSKYNTSFVFVNYSPSFKPKTWQLDTYEQESRASLIGLYHATWSIKPEMVHEWWGAKPAMCHARWQQRTGICRTTTDILLSSSPLMPSDVTNWNHLLLTRLEYH